MENKERLVFVDYLRVVACFLVMLVHSSENFYAADASGLAGNVSMLANDANRFWVAFYDGGVARTCVPLFMMVSAFLLVPMKPGATMAGFYKHRFLRILPPFVPFAAGMGRYDVGTVGCRPEKPASQFPFNGRAFVVYVSSHQSLPYYAGHFAMA